MNIMLFGDSQVKNVYREVLKSSDHSIVSVVKPGARFCDAAEVTEAGPNDNPVFLAGPNDTAGNERKGFLPSLRNKLCQLRHRQVGVFSEPRQYDLPDSSIDKQMDIANCGNLKSVLCVTNNLIRTAICRNSFIQNRSVVMKVSAAQPTTGENYEQRNLRLKRPLSPHLLIYKPQLTSMLSITHRITGCALSVYALGFAAMSLSPGSFPHMVEAIHNMHISGAIIFPTKVILAFPAAYHLCNGIRHLVWDFGKALTIKQVYTTGYIQVTASSILTLLFASL